jgi:hypothetical protein
MVSYLKEKSDRQLFSLRTQLKLQYRLVANGLLSGSYLVIDRLLARHNRRKSQRKRLTPLAGVSYRTSSSAFLMAFTEISCRRRAY